MRGIEAFEKHATEYDRWYGRYPLAYQSEVEAVRSLIPRGVTAVEVGVGTGRFALALGVRVGVEPSEAMAALARQRGISVLRGIAERLPLQGARLDLVMMITTVCFLDDVSLAFEESRRVLAPGGHVLVGFIDKESCTGKPIVKQREGGKFLGAAKFYSTREILSLLKRAGFLDPKIVQTLFQDPHGLTELSPVRDGYGEGMFVVVRGRKALADDEAP